MLLAAWNCFSIPFIVAFLPEADNILAIVVVDYIIDSIFVVDIALNFRTTFFSRKTGDEIMEPKRIAKNYLFD